MRRLPDPPLVDETLSRLGREWFAEARLREQDAERTEKRSRPSDGGDGSVFDWLFGSDDGGDADGCGGDGGD